MSNIGLYIYKIKIHDGESHSDLKANTPSVMSEVTSFIKKFRKNYSATTLNPSSERSWELTDAVENNGCFEGIVKYGIYGHSSEITDSNSNKPLFNRAENHIEKIPLYYQIYTDPQLSYLICAIQSFKTWSCVQTLTGAFATDYRIHTSDKRYVTFHKLMPSELALYANNPVTKLTLRKKATPSDKFNALKDLAPEKVNLEMTFTLKRGGVFGQLSNVEKQIRKNSQNNILIEDGVSYDEVTANVKVGRSIRKVGIIGRSVNAGVIDITDDVQTKDGHPTFSSVSKCASENIADFVLAIGH